MRTMDPRWDPYNKRWECSVGSGKTRKWFRSKMEGQLGRDLVLTKRERYLHAPAPLRPGSLAEFVENVWWPRHKAGCSPETLRKDRSTLKVHLAVFYGMQVDEIEAMDIAANEGDSLSRKIEKLIRAAVQDQIPTADQKDDV